MRFHKCCPISKQSFASGRRNFPELIQTSTILLIIYAAIAINVFNLFSVSELLKFFQGLLSLVKLPAICHTNWLL